MKVKDVLANIEKFAPYRLQCEWDNSGFLIGKAEQEVKSALVSLDLTGEVIDEATENGCNLIVTHHPAIFGGIKSITEETEIGKMAIKLIENGISYICAHTNLDVCDGGINDTLCALIGLENVKYLGEEKTGGAELRIGDFSGSLETLLNNVKTALSANLRVSFSEDKEVKKVAVCGGSGCDFLEVAKFSGADVLLTADGKYHDFQRAKELGVILVDAGHFETETIICKKLSEIIGVPSVISEKHKGFYRVY